MEQDMAGTTGPLVSPEMFEELCFPEEAYAARQKARSPSNFHSCGHTLPLMDSFLRAGIDCYQSLQMTAGMGIDLLKRQYGARMASWGGIPVETLIAGTPQEVREEVRVALEAGAPGSGVILGPSHSVIMNTSHDTFRGLSTHMSIFVIGTRVVYERRTY